MKPPDRSVKRVLQDESISRPNRMGACAYAGCSVVFLRIGSRRCLFVVRFATLRGVRISAREAGLQLLAFPTLVS